MYWEVKGLKSKTVAVLFIFGLFTSITSSWTAAGAPNVSISNVSTQNLATDLDSGLVGYWKFDEGSGTTVGDSSGNGNTGTINGATWTSDSVSGQALDFDGLDDYIEIQDSTSLHISNTITVAAWVKYDAIENDPDTNAVVTKRSGESGFSLHIVSDHLRFNVGSTYFNHVEGATVLQPGEWYHLVGTYDGTTQKVYVNGSLDGSKSYSDQLSSNTAPLFVGLYISGETGEKYGYFPGVIDEIRVYNRALNADEIKELYQRLAAHWKFDEGSGTTASDSSGNGNDGTIYGATWTSNAVSGKALSFDGANDYVSVSPSVLPETSAFSITAWIKADAFIMTQGGYPTIFSRSTTGDYSGELYIVVNTTQDNTLRIMLITNEGRVDLNGSTSLKPYTWYFIVTVYDGSTISVWINENLDSSTQQSGIVPVYNKLAAIGVSGVERLEGKLGYFDGIIDEVRIYNRALSVSEIKSIYESEKPVVNNPPSATFTYSPLSPTTNDTIQFTNQSTDSDGTIVSWSWSFGDGTGSTSQNPTHKYSTQGTYTVTLTVTDDDGAQANTSKTITVSTPPTSKISTTLTVSPSTFSLTSGQTTTLTATLTDSSGSKLANKTISWSTNAGSLSSASVSAQTSVSTTTDANGQTIVTFSAPDVLSETKVTITASFVGDSEYNSSTVSASGTVNPKTQENITSSKKIQVIMTISPGSFVLTSGKTTIFTATLTDSAGNPISNKTVSWDATAGSFSLTTSTTNSSGQVSAVYVGPNFSTSTQVVITASFAGDDEYLSDSASATGTISPSGAETEEQTSTSIQISPESFQLASGGSTTVTAPREGHRRLHRPGSRHPDLGDDRGDLHRRQPTWLFPRCL